MCQVCWMNTLLAVASGGVMLLLVGRSLLTLYRVGQTEMSVGDRRVARAVVAALLVAFVALVLLLQFARR